MSPSTRANDEKVTTTGTSTSAATARVNSIQPLKRGQTKTPAVGVFARTAALSDKISHDYL
jgi:hypothetical protein